jgi:hypothetical protein
MDPFSWFLMTVFSNFMLPLFMVASLCIIAGARPEPVITGLLSIVGSVVTSAFSLMRYVISACIACACGTTPKPRVPRTPRNGGAGKRGQWRIVVENPDDPGLRN